MWVIALKVSHQSNNHLKSEGNYISIINFLEQLQQLGSGTQDIVPNLGKHIHFKKYIFTIYQSSPNSLSSENNNVEVNFNIHVMATTGIDEVSKTMQTGPVMTITSTTVDPEINTVNNNGHTNTNGVMTNAQQSAMSNMFKQFFK